jgi:hypothetical protein
MATPPRIMVSGLEFLNLARARIPPEVMAANKKALVAIHHRDRTPKKMVSAAPKAAPEEIPKVKGEARGLRKIAWATAPLTARPAPTSMPIVTLGRRRRKKTLRSMGEAKISRKLSPKCPIFKERRTAKKDKTPKRRIKARFFQTVLSKVL